MSERNLEDEYFQRLNAEKKARMKKELDAKEAQEARAAAKDLHYHMCGKCGAKMDTRVYRGVEIEQCPDCGAVLLDPGELQQLAGEDNSGVVSQFLSIFGSGSSED